MKAKYSAEHKKTLDKLLLGLPGVRTGSMFGYPCYKVGRKMFCCVYDPGVALKLPKPQVEELLKKRGNVPFVVMDKRMKEWVMLVRKDSRSYAKLCTLFLDSLQFVGKTA